jgi:hypothetical protein
VLGVGILSLLYAQFMSKQDAELSFFLMPTRIWELLTGVGLAALESRRIDVVEKNKFTVIALIALGLILYSGATFSKTSIHPGYITLLPVAATGLIIFFSSPNDLVGKALSLKPMVYLGKLSYSLYLWHFPIFAFLRNKVPEPSWIQFFLCSLLALFLSAISYQYVEKPFRNKRIISTRLFLMLLVCFFSGLLIAVWVLGQSTGLTQVEKKLSSEVFWERDNPKLRSESWELIEQYSQKFSDDKKVNVLIVGDSHSKDLYNALIQNSESFQDLSFVRNGTLISCFQKNNEKVNAFFDHENYKNSDVVFVSSQFFNHRNCDRSDQKQFSDLEGLKILLTKASLDNKVTVVASNTVEFPYLHNRMIVDYMLEKFGRSMSLAQLQTIIGKKYYEGRYQARPEIPTINKKIKEIAEKTDTIYLEKSEFICDRSQQLCFGLTPEGKKVFYDYGHFTLAGAKFFGERIVEINWLEPLFSRLNNEVSQ